MEEKEIESSKQLGKKWNQRNSGFKLRFYIIQLLSSIFSSISGIFTYTYINRYPATSFLSNISMNFGIGTILFGGINAANISGTLVSSIGKPKNIKIRRILTMIISLIIGFFGFIGLTRALPLGCIDLSGPFNQCTKYGVHMIKK